jgi:outer membrane protein assembly factor BamB
LIECNGKLYSGFSKKTSQNDNFYTYDIATGSWVARAVMPNISGTWAYVPTTIQNKICVFAAGGNKKNVYDPLTDSWAVSDCNVPAFSADSRMFIYNDKYYLYSKTDTNFLCNYNVSTDTFIPVTIKGWKMLSGPAFDVDGKFYCAGECEIYEIDIEKGKTIGKPELSDYFHYAYSFGLMSYLFEYNKKAYFLPMIGVFLSFTMEN